MPGGTVGTLRDARSCVAKASVAGRGRRYRIIVDGTGYRLRVEAVFANPNGNKGMGALEVSSNVGTPLAAWVDRSFAALDRCWSPVSPTMRQ